MKRRFSFDNAEQMAHDLRRTAAAVKGFALEVREIYYVLSPLLERLKSK